MSDDLAAPRVVVLMSTYDGERHVVEQLRSILSQLPPHGRVAVRDDGSRDGTVVAIQAVQDPRIHLTRGCNRGFGASFLWLLAQTPPDTELVMFADQDDVWLPDKIERAWRHLLQHRHRPALYASAQMLVDDALRPLHATPPWPAPPSFAGALTENVVTGCTAALNNAALRLLQRAGVPADVRFHDWWMYLVVSAFGVVVHDDKPSLLYRQHAGNHIGHGTGWLNRQLRIARFLRRHDWVGILLAQLDALIEHYGAALSPQQRALIDGHFARRNGRMSPRWRLVLSPRRWRHWLVGEIALRLLLGAYKLGLRPRPMRRL